MVFLAISASGLAEAISLACGAPVWCGSDAISEEAFCELQGQNVSRFVYPLAGQGAEILADAVATIREHHPNERIWVESEGEL
jgi:hypothetical protein